MQIKDGEIKAWAEEIVNFLVMGDFFRTFSCIPLST